jgi:hypothetical protein
MGNTSTEKFYARSELTWLSSSKRILNSLFSSKTIFKLYSRSALISTSLVSLSFDYWNMSVEFTVLFNPKLISV